MQSHPETPSIYTLKIFILVSLIIFSMPALNRGLVEFLVSEKLVGLKPASAETFRLPDYVALSKGAVIFPTQEAVLKKRNELVAAKKNFIFADLNAMEISLYQEGQVLKTYPIKAKGKEGSFFETPNGYYKIQSKEENHYSTIGNVWMPWSMHFYGNYFIHGWPYYPDGTLVSDAFSGGCIRLGSKDAEELFRLSKNGTEVLVYAGATPLPSDSQYFTRVSSSGRRVQGPDLPVSAALAADFETGQILFAKNKDTPYPIASVTKLVTALVSVETINRFKILTIPEDLLKTPGNSSHLAAGEEFKSEDLLYPLLLASANDIALLYTRSSWQFVDTMNKKARAIGMANTKFEDASGSSAENTSTAEDLFKLLQYLADHKKPIFVLSGLAEGAATSTDGRGHKWVNVSWPKDERFIGGKAGKTSEALETIAGVFRVKFSEYGERPVAIIALGSTDRIRDVKKIITHLENNFVYGKVLVEKDVPPPPVRAGASIYEAVKNFSKQNDNR